MTSLFANLGKGFPGMTMTVLTICTEVAHFRGTAEKGFLGYEFIDEIPHPRYRS